VALLMPVSGILGQRLGSRLRLIVMTGSVAVGLSCLYLLRLTPDSGYFDGLLPAFILRGAGIGLFMTASSLAVVSSVPLARSGLASGTVTMSRNIGTAMGVALLSAVFVHHVETELPARLPDAPPARVAQVTGAAEHFLPTGEGTVRQQTEETIVEGFVLIALATLLFSLVATAAAFFIRYQAPASQPGPAPAPPESLVATRPAEQRAL
jgi:MFS family permease